MSLSPGCTGGENREAGREGEREREREKERVTEKEREREKERDRKREAERERQREGEHERERQRESEKEKDSRAHLSAYVLRSPSRVRRTSKWPSALDKRMTHPMALAGMSTSIDSSAQDDTAITVASAKSLGTCNIRDHSPCPSAHNLRGSSASCTRRCKKSLTASLRCLSND